MHKANRIFLHRFGRMLLPRGFFLYDGRFYRVLPDSGLVNIVAAGLTEQEDRCIVQYDTLALCHGLQEKLLYGGSWQPRWLVSHSRKALDAGRMEKDATYEAEAGALIFQELLLERFDQTRSLEAFQDYRSWHYDLFGGLPGTEYWDFDEMWEDLQLRNYAAAEESLQRGLRKWRAVLEGRPSYAKRADIQAKNREFSRYEALLRSGDTAALDALVQLRTEASRQLLRDFFHCQIV